MSGDMPEAIRGPGSHRAVKVNGALISQGRGGLCAALRSGKPPVPGHVLESAGQTHPPPSGPLGPFLLTQLERLTDLVWTVDCLLELLEDEERMVTIGGGTKRDDRS